MSKKIVMNVLAETGYEEMYPFNPSMILNATTENTSTATNYNLTVNALPDTLTNDYGNQMGVICFIANVTNEANATITLNNSAAYPIVFADTDPITAGTLIAGRMVFVKYNNNQFYLILDKNQIGLGNVDNVSSDDQPISSATQTALDNKLNLPQLIPANANLNDYQTPGMYYNPADAGAQTMSNIPDRYAFCLFVEQHAGVKQTFTTYIPGPGVRCWVRNYYNGNWGSWVQQAYVLYGTGNPNDNAGFDGNIYVKIS